MEIVFSDVGNRISKRIKGLGMRQLDICNKTGLSTTALSQYCTGKRVPDTVSLYKIAIALGVSMEWVLTGEDVTSEDFRPAPLDLEAVKQEQGLTCDGSPLNNVEADLVAMFRLLPEEEREDVFDIVHLKYKRRLGKKAESIYWTYFDESGDEESGPAEGREARDGTA
ncbi:helix-turn-helix transcriptional regulator [Oscillibacter valericigenes]|nr:helix-turn-helix transcriptional regulator [Oscillibacter valericigenes]